jgi:N-methylhydantoinase A
MTGLRFAADTGGTFTDLVIEDGAGGLSLYKSPTRPEDPVAGVLDVFGVAAAARGVDRAQLLGAGSVFIHGTTRGLNAILTGTAARTAFLTTAGHPDILSLREGGRTEPFNHTRAYPGPYVPRSLTFEVPERVLATGEVRTPLDEEAVIAAIGRLAELEVEAVAVCLLWSMLNPAHEERIGALLEEHLPGVPYTLSHRLNPTIREYRRACSTCIDASLKPTMSAYFDGLAGRMREAGFTGRVLVISSTGGIMDAADVARAPIHSLNSGPAMAPVAGRRYATLDGGSDTAVVVDTGGTSFDVSLVRHGRVPRTREMWLGAPMVSDMTGFPSVDIRSIGAGGGSIAWVDEGGLLHVGPQSAGAVPGPACYGRGGTEPTLTDACLVLGYLDPASFLGGEMRLDDGAARTAVERTVGEPLGLGLQDAAEAIVRLATERMVRAIEETTLEQGIDARSCPLVGGGGAAGLNIVAIARSLGCPRVILPDVGSALSAAGALMSDLTAEFSATEFTATPDFDFEGVNRLLARLVAQCQAFIDGPGAGCVESAVEVRAEARYPHQVWELELPARTHRFERDEDVEELREDFDALHQEVFQINDPGSPVEIVGWQAQARCRLADARRSAPPHGGIGRVGRTARPMYFRASGEAAGTVVSFDALAVDEVVTGPAVVELPLSSVVIDPGASARRHALGSLVIDTRINGDSAP